MAQLTTQEACSQPIAQVLEQVNSDAEHGLESVEAARRLRRDGPNEFEAEEKDPLWKRYLEQFKDPLIYLLMGSAAVSVLMGQFDDAISITAAIVIVVTVAFVQEYRSEKSLEELTKLVPHRCHCIRDGRMHDIDARELVVGDMVHFGVGDRIPADVRLASASDLQIDESSLTGETHPARKSAEPVKGGRQLADRKSVAYMGTLVRHGHGLGVVIATGEKSEFGVVFHMLQDVDERRTPLQQDMDDLGKRLSIFSFGIIAVILLIGLVQRRDMVKMFAIGVSLAVAAIPEGLPIVVTVTLALGVMRMAKRNAIVKKLPAVEALGSATVICSDKTGTITENQMTVRRIYSPSDGMAEVSGIGYSLEGEVALDNHPVGPQSAPGIAKALEVGVLCNNSELREGDVLGQPTEGALLVAAIKFGLADERRRCKRSEEIPFSSSTKWMAVRCPGLANPDGPESFFVKGATFAVLQRCTHVYVDKSTLGPMTQSERERIESIATEMASEGLRVLALASGPAVDKLVFAGLVGVLDPPRRGVVEAIGTFQESGVSVVMITGDMRETAEAIGQKLGLFDARKGHKSLSGQEVDGLSMDDLRNMLDRVHIFYRVSPRHKMKIVEAYQQRGNVVAMTGDGVNDAPALKMADIGVAMGKSGTDVAKEAADMILVDDNFTTIMAAIEEGKGIGYNIRNFLRFQLSTSVAALSLITISTLGGFANPLNAMQILWINILMDGPPAQSLGVEPVDPDVRSKPPRRRTEPIITRALVINVLVAASIIVAGTLYVFKRESEDGQVTRRDTTMTFTAFVLFDMFNALSCRSQEKSLLTIGLFSNRMFLWAVGGSLLGQLMVIYFAPLQEVFQTEALSIFDLAFLVCLTSTVFVVDECRKWYRRNQDKERRASIPDDGEGGDAATAADPFSRTRRDSLRSRAVNVV